MALAALLGFVWMLMVGVQTRLFVNGRSQATLFAWVFSGSIVWGYLVRAVTLNAKVIPAYALGTAIGAVISVWLSKKWESK